MGVSEDLAQGSIRVSLGPETEWEELKSFIDALEQVVIDLRELST